jgi:transcriptional regulator CtsR
MDISHKTNNKMLNNIITKIKIKATQDFTVKVAKMADMQTTTTTDRQLITDKELNYIKDFLSWELLAMKKCSDAAKLCMDSNIQSLIRQTGEKHKQHYQTILAQLH